MLGIGNNGHIGFNEPGTPIGSTTHIVELTQSTREANARFFGYIDDVPTHAVTMGIKTVMNAKSIILIALGKGKAETIKNTLQGKVTPEEYQKLIHQVELFLSGKQTELLKQIQIQMQKYADAEQYEKRRFGVKPHYRLPAPLASALRSIFPFAFVGNASM